MGPPTVTTFARPFSVLLLMNCSRCHSTIIRQRANLGSVDSGAGSFSWLDYSQHPSSHSSQASFIRTYLLKVIGECFRSKRFPSQGSICSFRRGLNQSIILFFPSDILGLLCLWLTWLWLDNHSLRTTIILSRRVVVLASVVCV